MLRFRIIFRMVFRTADIIEMYYILTFGNKIFHNSLKSILQKKKKIWNILQV